MAKPEQHRISVTYNKYLYHCNYAMYNRSTVRTSQQVLFEHQSAVESLIYYIHPNMLQPSKDFAGQGKE